MVLALIIVRNERTVPCTPMELVTNSNTSRLGSQRANTETWTKSSSQNSVAVAAALPPFTATPPLPNSAVATTMAWGTVRSAMAECQRSSWCMYKLSCSQRHRHRLCSWRTRTAAADSFEPRNTGRQTDSSSLHGEKFARFWFHPFFSFFSPKFFRALLAAKYTGKLVVRVHGVNISVTYPDAQNHPFSCQTLDIQIYI